MIEAAIFDMDGVLIDSEPTWRKAHSEAVADLGASLVITEEDIKASTGKRTDEVVARWIEKFGLDTSVEELEAAIVNRVIAHIVENGEPMPGVLDAISMFGEHSVPMAIASSSSPELIETVVNKLGISDVIQLAYSATHEEFGKPHPGVFLTTAQKLGVAATQCLVFEDSVNGVKAAKAAGMVCVAIPEQPYDPQNFEMADIVLPSMTDVTWPLVQSLLEKE